MSSDRIDKRLRFFYWFKKILYLWVKSRALPKDRKESLGIDPDKPVCYILRTQSYSDLLVLDYHCKKMGLPRPLYRVRALKASNEGAYIYISPTGLIQRKNPKGPPSALMDLVKQVDEHDDVQIVPVSVFWGRHPGNEDQSVLKLLFFDDEYGGFFQRFIRISVQGRDVICNFGKPISVRKTLNEGLGVEQTTKKIRRVLKVHFKTLRNSTLGPSIYDHAQVVSSLLNSKQVKEVIKEEAEKKKVSEEKIRKKARKYIEEVISRKTMSYIKAGSYVLAWLWNKIFNGVVINSNGNMNPLTDDNYEVIYVPCHRSHLDYLLITYSIHQLGFVTPHIAAGVNLNFWPMGGALRRMGAFFLRRSFKGNKLYSTVFNQYVNYLITKGYSLMFFPEGGRSRTGRLKEPMTGMLAMVVRSFIMDPSKKVVFVPTYVGYDKVIETGSYLKELGGKAKKSESMGQLLGSWRILKSQFGKAYVGFGEPIHLDRYLDKHVPDWKERAEWYEKNTSKLTAINELAEDIMIGINSSVSVSPSALFALALLSSQKKALSETDLLAYVDLLKRYIKAVPYSEDLHMPLESSKDQLAYVEGLVGMQRFSHPDGDVIFLDEISSIHLTYYRNNVLHLFATPSVIAAFFLHNHELSKDGLKASCKAVYPYLKDELFLRWDQHDFDEEIDKALGFMIEEGLLQEKGNKLYRPMMTEKGFSELNLMGRSLGRIIERYAVFAAVLSQFNEYDEFDRAEVEAKSQKMAHKIAILNGTNDPDFFDKGLFRNHIKLLTRMTVLEKTENGKLKVNPILRVMTEHAMALLSIDVRQSIYKETNCQKEE